MDPASGSGGPLRTLACFAEGPRLIVAAVFAVQGADDVPTVFTLMVVEAAHSLLALGHDQRVL